MTYENPDETELVEIYGDQSVAPRPGFNISLRQLLEAESLCSASSDKLKDSTARLGYLARRLEDAGSLRDEHAHLLIEPSD